MLNKLFSVINQQVMGFMKWPIALSLSAMMLITVFDVLGRSVLGKPLPGSIELTQLCLGLMVFAAFPLVVWRKEHIAVDLLDNYIPTWFAVWRDFLVNMIAALVMILLSIQFQKFAQRALNYGDVTEFLKIPKHYLMYAMTVFAWVSALMSILVGFSQLYQFYRPYNQVPHND